MTTPAPPPGFILERTGNGVPPPPPGFQLVDRGGPDYRSPYSNLPREQRQAQLAAIPRPEESLSLADRAMLAAEPFAREVALGGRAMLEGIGSTLGIVTDPVAAGVSMVANAVAPQQQTLSGLMTGERPQELRIPTAREGFSSLADLMGAPKPQTASERIGSDVTSALTGGLLPIGLGRTLAANGSRVTSRLGELMQSMPGAQLASAAAGAGAAGAARETGGGPGTQLAAGLLGGLAPSFGPAAFRAGVRGAVRGGEPGRQAMEGRINDFQVMGAEPSVGQAAGNFRTQGLESLLAGAPTSTGVMTRAAERQADSIGSGLQSLADDFMPNASAERAGRSVVEGVRGERGFVQTSRQVADDLYRKLDAAIPSGSRVPVQNTRAALADLNTMIEGAPSVSRFFQNARLEGIERGLLSDVDGAEAVLTQPGMREQVDAYRAYLKNQQAQAVARNNERRALNMSNLEPVPTDADIEANIAGTLGNMVDQSLPYEALQKLRTLVGNEIENVSLASDVPRSKWKALYGALSRDMEAAATTPEAKQALKRANNYYNARIARLDAIDHAINRAGGPEKVFSAVMSGTKDGGTTLRAVMQSLPKDGQRALTAAVIKRMGLATPGAQDAAGEVFSASTFLTNWNRVSPEAKRALFNRHGPKFVENMNKIARVADNIKSGSKVFANPPGTTNRAAAYTYGATLASSAAYGVVTGSVAPFAVAVLGGIGANVGARMLTNPAIVSWLARSTEMPISALPQQVLILKAQARSQRDPELAEFAEALQAGQERPSHVRKTR